jgi:hypothetical protein
LSERGEADDFLRKALEDTCPEGHVVTHWVMIMETFDGSDQDLHMASSPSVTPWLALGMLEAAKKIVQLDTDDED